MPFAGLGVYFKVKAINKTAFVWLAIPKRSFSVFEHLLGQRRAVVAVCIGPQVQVNKIERLRRVVGIVNGYKCIQLIRGIVQCYLNFVIGTLLPVVIYCLLRLRV